MDNEKVLEARLDTYLEMADELAYVKKEIEMKNGIIMRQKKALARLRKALEEIEEWTHPECYPGVDVIATIGNVATEALKDGK